jgi:putative ABC transport system permease protein
MLSIKLAWRNLIGAGLRTWLNVFVLSLSFLIIIWHKGIISGWDRQAQTDTINQEIGGGVYWHENYDPYDIFTLTDSHSKISKEMESEVQKGKLAPILFAQSTIYPEGRIQTVIMKGIAPNQQVLDLPTNKLNVDLEEIPAIIGRNMAKNNHLKIGDFLTIRWRDANGVFDANELKIVHIFKTNVPTIDNGQIWIPLDRAQKMLQMPNEATIAIINKENGMNHQIAGWTFKDHDFLLKEIRDMIKMKSFGGYIIWLILLSLAWLAIFDTQVLSIFRRQKEIGTDIALGMTRGQVIKIFTVEGAMNGFLAAIFAAIYGTPLLYLQAKAGWSMPAGTEDMGMAIADTIYPYYGLGMIAVTATITLLSVIIVSF